MRRHCKSVNEYVPNSTIDAMDALYEAEERIKKQEIERFKKLPPTERELYYLNIRMKDVEKRVALLEKYFLLPWYRRLFFKVKA